MIWAEMPSNEARFEFGTQWVPFSESGLESAEYHNIAPQKASPKALGDLRLEGRWVFCERFEGFEPWPKPLLASRITQRRHRSVLNISEGTFVELSFQNVGNKYALTELALNSAPAFQQSSDRRIPFRLPKRCYGHCCKHCYGHCYGHCP